MRRLFTLCLLGVLAMAPGGLIPGLVHSAEAAPAKRDGKATASKTAKALNSARGAAARQAAQPLRSASRPAAARTRQAVAKPSQIARRGKLQRTASRAPARAMAPRRTSWQAGLPMASGEQRECPIGTMSTLARGHDDVVRCLPL